MVQSGITLAVFDLDGTLNRTDLFAVPAARTALEELGMFGIPDHQIIANFGASDEEYINKMVPHLSETQAQAHLERVSELERVFMKEYHGEYCGVTQSLQTLRQQGIRTAVCSNAEQSYIEYVLDMLNLTDLIDEIQPIIPGKSKADSLKNLLNRINPNHAVMIGDRYYDRDAAKANSIPFIGCLYGFGADEVSQAAVTVKRAEELSSAVLRLLSK